MDQISNDGEYLPDSESQDEDGDDEDFMPQSKAKPEMPDVGASRSDTSVQDVPMVPSAAVASESGDYIQFSSKEKPEAETDVHKHKELTSQNMTIRNYCYIRGKPQSKISRHLKTHTTHAELVHVFSLPEKSKERKILLEKFRNKGNFKHNTAV